jgi:hypothetical protein
MSEKFSQKENGLYVPTNSQEDAPYRDTADQEMDGQNEVLGTDGHGSIRADSDGSEAFTVIDKRSSGDSVASPFDSRDTSDNAPGDTPEASGAKEVPDAQTLASDFAAKRSDLQAAYDKLEKNYRVGAKVRTHFETREGKLSPATIEINEAKAALDEVNEAWTRNGGEAIDAAQKELDDLDEAALGDGFAAAKAEKEAALEAAKKQFRDNFAAENQTEQTDETQPDGTDANETDETSSPETGIPDEDDLDEIGLMARAEAGEFSNHQPTVDSNELDELGPMARAEAGEWSGETQEPVADEAAAPEEAPETAPTDEQTPDNGNETTTSGNEVLPVTLPQELRERLELTKDKYAELTARDRKAYLGRFMKIRRPIKIGKREFAFGDLLRKIPGVTKLIDTMNSRSDRGVTEAKTQYEAAMVALQHEVYGQLEAQGAEQADINARAIEMALQYDIAFEGKVVTERSRQSKKTNKFVNWWVRQEGLKGKLKKGGVMLVGGALIGTAGVIAGAGFLATVPVAALAGGTAAVHVTGRRANGIVDKQTGATLAQTQSREDINIKAREAQRIYSGYNGGAWGIRPSELTKQTESRSDQEAAANRQRVRSSAGIAALGAKAAMWSNHLYHAFSDAAPVAPDAPAAPAAPNTPPPAESINSNVIVNPGDGYTDTLEHLASANGMNLSDSQSFELHNALMQKFGPDYINIQGTGGSDTYTQLGDVRLTAPGQAKYVDGVAQFAIDWMKSHRV